MKKVIVVGGGFAGAYIARQLQHEFLVTLIDTKNYFEFTPSILRTITEPDHMSKIEVLHTSYLTQASFIHGEVTKISNNKVFLGSKVRSKRIPFDYLVLAMGSTYSSPIKEKNLVIASRSQELREYAARLVAAKTVLIIGGGLVGVELAAEIATHFPSKKITLVHANSELIERNPPRARAYARRFLEQNGVKIIWNDRVESARDDSYKTHDGKKLSTDLAFLCTGVQPNYQCLLGECSSMLSDRNCICVDDYLQVEGHPNIFAAGDITALNVEKTAQNAERQAKIVVANLRAVEQGKSLVSYVGKVTPMVISLGKRDGIFVYKNFVFTGIIPAMMKTFVEWKTMKKYR